MPPQHSPLNRLLNGLISAFMEPCPTPEEPPELTPDEVQGRALIQWYRENAQPVRVMDLSPTPKCGNCAYFMRAPNFDANHVCNALHQPDSDPSVLTQCRDWEERPY